MHTRRYTKTQAQVPNGMSTHDREKLCQTILKSIHKYRNPERQTLAHTQRWA